MKSKVTFRCCDAEDSSVIANILADNILYNSETITSEIEEQIYNGKFQWYCLETAEPDDVIIAVARMQIFHDKILNTVIFDHIGFVTLTDYDTILEESIHRYFCRQLENISENIAADVITFDVWENDVSLQSALENIGFQESGGNLSDRVNTMVFKYSKKIKGDLDEPLGLFDELGILDLDVTASVARENKEMQGLISDLFKALHNSNITPEI